MLCCILSKFYIKPQLVRNYYSYAQCCILSKFYIKPQLRRGVFTAFKRCILSKFYIKPQLPCRSPDGCCVVSYRNSTSNHNFERENYFVAPLYLIEILHQTTTLSNAFRIGNELYLIEILHQTTTRNCQRCCCQCCILSKFYIKPQHDRSRWYCGRVVSYRNSTSNHNRTTANSSTAWCCILSKFYIKPQRVPSSPA